MDRIKAKINALKDAIEKCEERQVIATTTSREAESRLEAAENEKASSMRRVKILQGELAKINARVAKQNGEFNSLLSKTAGDDEVRVKLESQEVEGDERLESIAERAREQHVIVEELDKQYAESKRKAASLEIDVEKAENRYEAISLQIEECVEKLSGIHIKIKTLEENEDNQSEKDTENEEKLVFLREQLKESVTRADNAERDVTRLHRVTVAIQVDIDNWHNKKKDVVDEFNMVQELANDI